MAVLLVAAAVRAPLTGLMLVIEMTRSNYQLIVMYTVTLWDAAALPQSFESTSSAVAPSSFRWCRSRPVPFYGSVAASWEDCAWDGLDGCIEMLPHPTSGLDPVSRITGEGAKPRTTIWLYAG
jgi:hypothetical protein